MLRGTLIVLILAACSLGAKLPTKLALTPEASEVKMTSNFDTNENMNTYELSFSSEELMKGKFFGLVFESNNPEFSVAIIDTENGLSNNSRTLIDLLTYSGSMLFVMSDSYFNGKLDFVRKNGSLSFRVYMRSRTGIKDYTIKAFVSKDITLGAGVIYTSRVDMTISKLPVKLVYEAIQYPKLRKLRFQLTAVKHKTPFSLAADLRHKKESYVLNNYFGKVTGGVLTGPVTNVCTTGTCVYSLDISLSNVKTLSIESFLIADVERLSITHYEEFYDRTFEEGVVNNYELPYDESMEDMDISITLIPVTATPSLHINAKTLQSDVDTFDWKEKGGLAKRLTIRWSELKDMLATKDSLYIAVKCPKPGEYLLKVDAHEPGYKGRLVSGVYEQGFVESEELLVYLYLFEVVETQEIEFQIDLNTVTGNVHLYLRQCDKENGCRLDKSALDVPGIIKSENNQQAKSLHQRFTCHHKSGAASTQCEFAIGILGKENRGSHFEVSLTPQKFHRMMLPGHTHSLRLESREVAYLKFSNPSSSFQGLSLSIQPLWGTFEVFFSRTEQFPSASSRDHVESFTASKNGLYSALKTLDSSSGALGRGSSQGAYYIAVQASSASAMTLKFFQKNDATGNLHMLVAGDQARGEISSKEQIVYYTFKVSLDDETAGSINLVLTPLKGRYKMFGRRDGLLPTPENAVFTSENHHLTLTRSTEQKKAEEFIIGVKLSADVDLSQEQSFQFLLSLSYASRPLRLDPGVLTSHHIDSSNYFFIEVHEAMMNILIIKTVKDGYNLDMCAVFSSNQDSHDFSNCAYTARDRNVAIYIPEATLKENCAKFAAGTRCIISVSVTGRMNQGFGIGFTYNDQPFHLVRNQQFQGPIVLSGEERINFVYHVESRDLPVSIYFNSKGQKVAVFSKLVNSKDLEGDSLMTFPTAASSDKNVKKDGHITSIVYTPDDLAKFAAGQTELLISVRSIGGSAKTTPFDLAYNFALQVATDAREIIRTEVLHVELQEDKFEYFTLYNNGDSNSLRIYANANIATRLEVIVAQGLQARPPITTRGIASKVGMTAVELELTMEDLKFDAHKNSPGLKNYFVIAVKSSIPCTLDLFWNNNEALNFLELTPNTPISMTLDQSRNLYFSIFAKDVETKGNPGSIYFYVKTSVRANIYILKSNSGELELPSASNFIWKNSIPEIGGLAMIEIPSTDPNYCSDCSYIGAVETVVEGVVMIMGSIKNDGTAMLLKPGFTIPCFQSPRGKSLYRINNPDADIVDLGISMLTGTVNIYISDTIDVTETKYKEMHSIEAEMQIHKFIVINPSNFGITTPHDFYVLISNPKLDPSAFTLNIDKNSFRSPIEPGITKYVNLGPQESTEFFYKPKAKENLFEVRMELRQVFDKSQIDDALKNLVKFIDVFHLSDNDKKYELKYKSKSESGNKIYITFDITDNSMGVFTVRLKNVAASGVAISLDLLNGNYKLVNLNEFVIDVMLPGETQIYEAYSSVEKLLFIDIRTCAGDVKTSLYQGDYDNVLDAKSVDFKTIKDTNSFMHYHKVNSTRVFLKLENERATPAIFQIGLLNEKDMDVNPYSEITHGDGGKVSIETDNHLLRFEPINIRSTYSNQFVHRITYTAYLSDDFQVMRFGRNCANFMIEEAFKEPHLKIFSTVVEFVSVDAHPKDKNLAIISVNGLRPGTKYFGVVVAKIELFPLESGYLSPSRSAIAYYDEFVFVTSKFSIPFNLIISAVICTGFMMGLFCIVKSYIFGNISRFQGVELLGDMNDFDENVLGFNIIGILERESEEGEEQAHDGHSTDASANHDGGPTEIEMTDKNDRTQPLDS